MAKYKCGTLGDCERANLGEVFERSAGDDLNCPGCAMQLELQAPPSTGPGKRTPLIAAVAVAVVALAAGGAYLYLRPAVMVASAVAEALPAAAVAVAELAAATPAASVGIAPADTETKALRLEGDVKLASGAAAEAEAASGKAAANEMLKLAISKMSQGKLDDAEKELMEARARAPKQPLVFYNLAILRLKQGRTDDALTEFENSFANGFTYFEQMDKDTDLDSLRATPRFAALMQKYRTTAQ